MGYEQEVDMNEYLMPVRAETLVVTDGNIPPKTRKISAVMTCKGRRITTDIPVVWARFIADAMNRYFQELEGNKNKEGKLIASLVIDGDPKGKDDGRQIKVTETGRYIISHTKIYDRWIRNARNNFKNLFVVKPSVLPIKTKVCIQCTFFVKPKKHPIPLPDLCASAIDCLHEIGVIYNMTSMIIGSIDGSRIIPASENHRTEIVIREYREV